MAKYPRLAVLVWCGIHIASIQWSMIRADDQGARSRPLESLECDKLQMGQYYCLDPEIDSTTQRAINCSRETRTVLVACMPVSGLICDDKEFDGKTVGLYKEVPCKWTNGASFGTALLLSVFLGMFGVDRFYLGYPAIGLLKLCTLGFMFLGQLIDVLLIAMQVVVPSDGSDYIIDFYGAGLIPVKQDNETFIQTHYHAS